MLYAGYHSSAADQRFIVARLRRERVPFVVVDADKTRALVESYRIVGDYVLDHYSVAAETDFGGPPFLIYVAREIQRLWSVRDGLPCLVPAT